MSYNIISDFEKINLNDWDYFVKNHPNGNVFQTPYIYNVYKNTSNYKPIGIFITDSKNGIVGVLISVIQSELNGLMGMFSTRVITFGGPLVKDYNAEITELILEYYKKLIGARAIYSQFRNLWDTDLLKHVFVKHGFTFEEHLNLLHDLKPSKEELWNKLHSKRRNEIRKAYKEEVTVEICDNLRCLELSYSILNEVYKKAKIPLANFELFRNLLIQSTPSVGMKVFVAKHNNKIVGCMLALVFKDNIYDFYAGSFRTFYKKNPNDLIPWEVMNWGKSNGYLTFDFGGAGKPNEEYGVRDYKKKFGGEFVNFGRYEIIHNKLLYSIGKVGLTVWKKIKF